MNITNQFRNNSCLFTSRIDWLSSFVKKEELKIAKSIEQKRQKQAKNILEKQQRQIKNGNKNYFENKLSSILHDLKTKQQQINTLLVKKHISSCLSKQSLSNISFLTLKSLLFIRPISLFNLVIGALYLLVGSDQLRSFLNSSGDYQKMLKDPLTIQRMKLLPLLQRTTINNIYHNYLKHQQWQISIIKQNSQDLSNVASWIQNIIQSQRLQSNILILKGDILKLQKQKDYMNTKIYQVQYLMMNKYYLQCKSQLKSRNNDVDRQYCIKQKKVFRQEEKERGNDVIFDCNAYFDKIDNSDVNNRSQKLVNKTWNNYQDISFCRKMIRRN